MDTHTRRESDIILLNEIKESYLAYRERKQEIKEDLEPLKILESVYSKGPEIKTVPTQNKEEFVEPELQRIRNIQSTIDSTNSKKVELEKDISDYSKGKNNSLSYYFKKIIFFVFVAYVLLLAFRYCVYWFKTGGLIKRITVKEAKTLIILLILFVVNLYLNSKRYRKRKNISNVSKLQKINEDLPKLEDKLLKAKKLLEIKKNKYPDYLIEIEQRKKEAQLEHERECEEYKEKLAVLRNKISSLEAEEEANRNAMDRYRCELDPKYWSRIDTLILFLEQGSASTIDEAVNIMLRIDKENAKREAERKRIEAEAIAELNRDDRTGWKKINGTMQCEKCSNKCQYQNKNEGDCNNFKPYTYY